MNELAVRLEVGDLFIELSDTLKALVAIGNRSPVLQLGQLVGGRGASATKTLPDRGVNVQIWINVLFWFVVVIGFAGLVAHPRTLSVVTS